VPSIRRRLAWRALPSAVAILCGSGVHPLRAQGTLTDLGTIGGYTGSFTYIDIGPYQAEFTTLATTATETNGSELFAITPDGMAVVGAAGTSSGVAHAFVWTAPSGMVDIGSLASNEPSVALATSSNAGVVVGGALNSAGLVHAFEWTPSQGMVDLAPQLNGLTGVSIAHGVSADGSVVVGTLNPVTTSLSAFRWSAASGMTTLGSIDSNGAETSALGISADGSTTVGWGISLAGQGAIHSVLWHQNGVAVDLGAIGGIAGSSMATAVNQDGSVIVGDGQYVASSGILHAYRWTAAGGMVDLGTLLGPTSYSEAFGVSADGSIVVGTSFIPSTGQAGHAFIWTALGGMQDLNTMLTNAGVNLTGITLISARGISANGNFVTGDETTTAIGSDTAHAFLARIGGGAVGLTTPESIIASFLQLANSMTAQLINGTLLSSVLLGVNEQLSCADCGGGYLSFGSFTLGGHGRYDLNDEWTVLAGASYGRYREEGADVTSSWTLATSLRFDPAGMGSSRPFAEAGLTAAPDQHVTYTRPYADGASMTTATGDTSSGDYAAYARVGWIDRLTRTDELGAYAQFTQEWQTVRAYSETVSMSNPFEATVPSGSNAQSVMGVGAQYTHLFGRYTEFNLNGGVAHAAGVQSSIDASVAGYGDVRLRPPRLTWETVGGRIGRRVGHRVTLDLFADTVLGPRQIGSSVHGGVDFNIRF
jgi:probable HAF family extracellular repeat protein